ncbi:DUF2785 domain-containing protein [Halobacillus litoralis]|uniref:DUF2785 domain-containing protein n=1 Tax=Halobacillus litoralis TaxID=45668 RepID=UPI001CD1A5A1|nr:DUF2785 domain-containing protein [Halobacillus litoralis]MCA0970591.1 DUF2785 domain-containing protein [Halobacillus litoralis]
MTTRLSIEPMNEEELKSYMIQWESGQKQWSTMDTNKNVCSMIEHIGSTDPVLRDELIYRTFFKIIIERPTLTPNLLNELVQVCLDDRLMKGIGEKNTDSVFTRSFTTLLLALIIGRDSEEPFLNKSTVIEMKDKLLSYTHQEKDFRGFVPGKGWAHSTAHVADTLDELVKNPNISNESYPEILQALWSMVLTSESAYIHDEDERILVPVFAMMERGLDVSEITKLIHNLPEELSERKNKLKDEEYWYLLSNVKTFLKSFYVAVGGKPEWKGLQQTIGNSIHKL